MCTCVRLEELLEWHRRWPRDAAEGLGGRTTAYYYFSGDLCPSVGEFLVQIGGADAVGRQEVGSGLGSRRTTLGKIWDLAKKVAVVV